MEKTNLKPDSVKILQLLKTERKEMNHRQISSSTKIDEHAAMVNLNNLENSGYLTSYLKEEKVVGDRKFFKRYFSITEKGLAYPTD